MQGCADPFNADNQGELERGFNVSFAKQTVNHLPTNLPTNLLTSKKIAFTLAEVLITLGIIGVVAALTLPSVIQNHKKQVTITQLKKAYSTLGQMLTRSYADNGPADLSGTVTPERTEEFFNTYWLKYFNNPNVLLDRTPYGVANPYKYLDGLQLSTNVYTNYSAARILFVTNDGTIYHVNIVSDIVDENGNFIKKVYSTNMGVYVDINGLKGPNVLSKDVFRYIVDFEKLLVKPEGYNQLYSSVNQNCKTRGEYCAAKIMMDGWKITPTYP